MGLLTTFDIEELKKEYNLNVFVETGTGEGDSLFYASQFNFETLHSIEYLKPLYDKCIERFNLYSSIKLWNGDSLTELKNSVIPSIKNTDRVLFWLDAHFLGADFHFQSYDSLINEDEKLVFPLQHELKLIQEMRDIKNDLFIIDDLRIYEDNNYDDGNWLDAKKFNIQRNTTFFNDFFDTTHHIFRMTEHQGYLAATPKQMEIL